MIAAQCEALDVYEPWNGKIVSKEQLAFAFVDFDCFIIGIIILFIYFMKKA